MALYTYTRRNEDGVVVEEKDAVRSYDEREQPFVDEQGVEFQFEKSRQRLNANTKYGKGFFNTGGY